MEFNKDANIDVALDHIEQLMASGQLRMYIHCDECKYKKTCENECGLGCTNWKLYKPKEVKLRYETGVKERDN